MPKKRSEHYVNNKMFYAALVEYNKDIKKAKENNLPKPRVSNYIGDCFLKIATHVSYKPNFINYMFREEMISDGIENCLQYIHNFNPDRYDNPFAYFTTVVFRAFIRRIEREKRQLEIKNRLIEKNGYDEVMSVDNGMMTGTRSDYNTMKDNIHQRNTNRT